MISADTCGLQRTCKLVGTAGPVAALDTAKFPGHLPRRHTFHKARNPGRIARAPAVKFQIMDAALVIYFKFYARRTDVPAWFE
jgi:hypothetical protein